MNLFTDRCLDVLKGHLKDYADEYLTKSGGKDMYNCPFCGSGTGDNGTGAFQVKKGAVTWKCYSGKHKGETSGNIFQLIGQVEGISNFQDQVKHAADIYGVKVEYETNSNSKAQPTEGKRYSDRDTPRSGTKAAPTPAEPQQTETKTEQQEEPQRHDYTRYFNWCNSNLYKTDYYRGISLDTLNRFNIGFAEDCKLFDGGGVSALIIPTSRYTYVARNTDPNSSERFRFGGKPRQMFNPEALTTTTKGVIFVTEGELDALTIIDAGGTAVALGGSNNQDNFIDYIKEHPPKVPLFLQFDPDEAGMKATVELGEKLRKLNISFWCMDTAHHTFCGWNVGYKDPNAYWQADRRGLQQYMNKVTEVTLANAYNVRALKKTMEDVQQEYARTAYMNKNAVSSYMEKFLNGIKEAANTPVIPTGFNNLDTLLDGGLYEGLYTVGAIPSLGKTTLVLQIADQIAAQGKDVLIFSLEMSRTELIAKSISRTTAQITLDTGGDMRNAKTVRGITDEARYEQYSDAESELISKSVVQYSEITDHIFIIEGVGNVGADEIRTAVDTHKNSMGTAPVVIVDYLQLIIPPSDRLNEKQTIDRNVMELKRISRDYKVPLIIISSFNRTNYSTAVNYASFKESGGIEYSSDVVIGLQLQGAGTAGFDVDAAKRENPRKIEAKILKNRNGETGKTAVFEYYAMFNLFIDNGNNEI